MENSFFEYRDKSNMDVNSSSEIENSFMDDSFAPKKTPAKKNQTVYVPESEDSVSEGETEEIKNESSKTERKSNVIHQIICSSDDDIHKKSITPEFISPKKVILSSSEDEDSLPMVNVSRKSEESSKDRDSPNKDESLKPTPRLSESFIGRKKKRFMILDSDTDNSIILEHTRQKKLTCLKDTPAKGLNRPKHDTSNMSYDSEHSVTSDESDDENDNDDKPNVSNKKTRDVNTSNVSQSHKNDKKEVNDSSDESDDEDDNDNISNNDKTNVSNNKTRDINDSNASENHNNDENKVSNDGNDSDTTVDYDFDKGDDGRNKSRESSGTDGDQNDDHMFMSRATRMSIMGIVPKDHESDDSDFIQSDSSTRPGSIASLADLPDCGINYTKTQEKEEDDAESSRITCSPISSPLRDITNRQSPRNDGDDKSPKNKSYNSPQNDSYKSSNSRDDVVDLTHIEADDENNKVKRFNVMEKVIDDDITIIDTKPEVIDLSSDSDDDLKVVKSPIKKSPKKERLDELTKKMGSDIKQYLVPPSVPNQVVYVKKHVRENELNKLQGLKEDLIGVRNLLDNMDLNTLPDGGVKLVERLTLLEAEVRRQGDKVANMVVEPDVPSPADVAKDGFNEQGLSWDDIQKASNAVQPRMFGRQAMATHMAERNLILDRLRDLHESLASRPPEGTHAPQPRALRSQLMPHQLHALAWLRWRETQRPRGGILADDMGLGKTITMISLIASDKEDNLDRHADDDDDEEQRGKSRLVRGGTLVVCPTSLMQQWAGEVDRHCAAHTLSVLQHHGANRATQPSRLAVADLVLTTYNILQRETDKNGVLARVAWRRVILDEAHVVRNHKAATSQAVSALRGTRRWALTGTPLHNRDLDLFALLKFLRCTPFDDLTMWKKWIDNKSLGGQERMSTIMRCVMLRRTKAQLQAQGQLACLPPRAAHQLSVTLTQHEMNVYQKVLVFSKTLFAQFLHQRAEKHSGGALPPGKDSEYAKMHKKMIALQGAKPVKSHEILVLLLRLRQVCCHCGLIAAMLDADSTADLEPDAADQDLLAELNKLSLEDGKRKSMKADDEVDEGEGTTAAEAIRSVLSPNNPVFNLDKRSSKITAVMDCLQENVLANDGEKAVVVSQWTSVLRLVEKELKKAKVSCVTLDGTVPVPARAGLVNSLNDPISKVRVMLLSLCAGGVGLNLCGANHLLLLDPHWNPQLEEQAQDRVYRVGQTRPVHVYRFMCLDTVEQSIRKLQEAKLEMANNVLTGARHNNASKLSIEDLKVLFNMGSS